MTEKLTAFKELIVEYLNANNLQHQCIEKASGDEYLIFLDNGFEILLTDKYVDTPIMELKKVTTKLIGGSSRLLAATELIYNNLILKL